MEAIITPRQTKYCTDIESLLSQLGHATNTQLLESLRKTYPNLSATTVHRATARLSERGHISQAPNDIDGSMRYDTNTIPHDHFMCMSCGILRDANIKDKVKKIVEDSINDCKPSGNLVVSGRCNKCTNKESAK